MSDIQDTSAHPDPLSVPKKKKKSFASDVLKIMGGTAFGQALGIVVLPILTRLFAPEAFGLLGVFSGVMAMLGVLVCLRYELTIILPEKESDAVGLFWVSMCIAFLVSGVVAIMIAFFGEQLAAAVDAPGFTSVLWLLPAGVLVHGIYTVLSHWNTRQGKFGRLAIAQVNSSVVTNGTKLGAGFSGFTSGLSLIVASLLGIVSAGLALGAQIWRDDRRILARMLPLRESWELICRYRWAAIFNSSSSLLQTISQNIPLILLGVFFGPAVVGYYLVGHKILKVPFNLLGKSIRNVFYQRAAALKNKGGDLAKLAVDTTQPLIILSLGVITAAIIVSPLLATLALGAEWRVAGEYMQWVVIWTCSSFITIPASRLSLVLHKEHINVIMVFSVLVARLGSLIVCGLLETDPVTAIAALSLSGLVFQVLYLIWLLRIAGVQVKGLLVRLTPHLALSATTAGTYVAFLRIGVPELYSMALLVAYGAIYAVFVLPYYSPLKKNLFKK